MNEKKISVTFLDYKFSSIKNELSFKNDNSAY